MDYIVLDKFQLTGRRPSQSSCSFMGCEDASEGWLVHAKGGKWMRACEEHLELKTKGVYATRGSLATEFWYVPEKKTRKVRELRFVLDNSHFERDRYGA